MEAGKKTQSGVFERTRQGLYSIPSQATPNNTALWEPVEPEDSLPYKARQPLLRYFGIAGRDRPPTYQIEGT